jgi:hypothetical protein
MDNPWRALPRHAPFVLDIDRAHVDAWNAGKPEFAPSWIHTGRLPEPRLGPVDAPVVLLQLNPSYDARAFDIRQIDCAIEALQDEQSAHACLAAPNDWWDETFSTLLKRFGRERLSRRVMSIEYFPYASARFDHAHLRLPSQEYTFALVRAALAADALFVVTRGLDLWIGAVPQLRAHLHKRVFRTRNRQRAFVSAGNLLGDSAFDMLCERLAR